MATPPAPAIAEWRRIRFGIITFAVLLAVGIAGFMWLGRGTPADGSAQLACSDFAQYLADLPLPTDQVEARVTAIFDNAKVSTTPGIADGAHRLLFTSDGSALASACSKVPPL